MSLNQHKSNLKNIFPKKTTRNVSFFITYVPRGTLILFELLSQPIKLYRIMGTENFNLMLMRLL
ncbi:MAG: hypothetical protein NVS3B3_09700 [Aquirhabdus sp.]